MRKLARGSRRGPRRGRPSNSALAACGLLAALVFASCAELSPPPGMTTPPVAGPAPVRDGERRAEGLEIVTIKGETFRLEVADNDVTRQAGLMHRHDSAYRFEHMLGPSTGVGAAL